MANRPDGDGAQGAADASPLKLMFVVAASIFSVEALLMYTLHRYSTLSVLQDTLADSISLVAVCSPMLYYLVYRPMMLTIEARKAGENKLIAAEETLRMSEGRLKEAQRIGKLGFLDWDLITNEIECSDETLRLYGLDAKVEKVAFEDIAKLVHPDDVDFAVKSLNNAIEKGAGHHVEHRIVRPDGTVIYVDTKGKVYRDVSGQPIRMLGTITDITGRKELERERENMARLTASALEETRAAAKTAEEANRLKSEFLANMSHELNTPLTSVLGYSRLANNGGRENAEKMARMIEILDQSGDPKTAWQAEIKSLAISARETARETAKFDNVILEQGQALYQLLNDLMELSMLESGQAKMESKRMSAFMLLAFVEEANSETSKAKGLTLSVNTGDFRSTDIVFLGDRKKLEKALNNLVQNAIKYSDKGGVYVTASIEGETVIFRVKDEGMGIQGWEKEDIFETFRQLDGSATRLHGGLGLGLSLAKKLVHAMGGSISVESEAGKGAEFTVAVPYRPVLDATYNA